MKILLDTDIGSDIDDAVCLAYLLAQRRCELMGITTVTADTLLRAKLASALCEVAQQQVPIFPGARWPMIVEERQTSVQQAGALSNWPHQDQFALRQATDFLHHTINDNPGEITLLTTGPLTNIALLFSIYPEVSSKLAGIVMMAGQFHSAHPRGEWNVWCDPHAAAIVYRTGVKVHKSVGLDVTSKCMLPDDQVRERFRHPLLRPVLDFAGEWFQHTRRITFHDPLTAVSIFNDDICTFTPGQVELTPSLDAPVSTVFRSDNSGPHQVASEVDVDRFFERYFDVFV